MVRCNSVSFLLLLQILFLYVFLGASCWVYTCRFVYDGCNLFFFL